MYTVCQMAGRKGHVKKVVKQQIDASELEMYAQTGLKCLSW